MRICTFRGVVIEENGRAGRREFGLIDPRSDQLNTGAGGRGRCAQAPADCRRGRGLVLPHDGRGAGPRPGRDAAAADAAGADDGGDRARGAHLAGGAGRADRGAVRVHPLAPGTCGVGGDGEPAHGGRAGVLRKGTGALQSKQGGWRFGIALFLLCTFFLLTRTYIHATPKTSTYPMQVLERVWPLLAPVRPLLFLDTVIGLDALLALQLPVAMLKVNAAEARGFVGPIPSACPPSPPHAPWDKEEREETEDAGFCAAVRGWLERHRHVRRLAVTSGPLRARLFYLREGGGGGAAAADGCSRTRLVCVTYHLPFIPPHEIVNPIGAGDCCSAVTLSAMLSVGEGDDEEDEEDREDGEGDMTAVRAFRLGLAAATASCCKEENSTYDLGTLWAVAAAIRIEVRVE